MDTEEKIHTRASITLKHGILCSIFHKWELMKTSDDGLTVYHKCKRCQSVKVFKDKKSTNPVDWNYFLTLANKV